jgi:hypothetical protein
MEDADWTDVFGESDCFLQGQDGNVVDGSLSRREVN